MAVEDRITGRPASMYQHRIRIRKAVDTQNSTTGEVVQTYADLDTVSPYRWAKIIPQGGLESINADSIVGVSTYSIYMRWDRVMNGITPKMIVTFGSRTLQIVSVNNTQERNVEIVLGAQELTA